MQAEQADENPLAGLMPITHWLVDYASEVFPSPRAWDFFRKAHCEELVRGGVLLLGSGRRPDYVDSKRIGQAVREILVRESIQRLEAKSRLSD